MPCIKRTIDNMGNVNECPSERQSIRVVHRPQPGPHTCVRGSRRQYSVSVRDASASCTLGIRVVIHSHTAVHLFVGLTWTHWRPRRLLPPTCTASCARRPTSCPASAAASTTWPQRCTPAPRTTRTTRRRLRRNMAGGIQGTGLSSRCTSNHSGVSILEPDLYVCSGLLSSVKMHEQLWRSMQAAVENDAARINILSVPVQQPGAAAAAADVNPATVAVDASSQWL